MKTIIIASRPRCGTHLLRTTIASADNVISWGEPFNVCSVSSNRDGHWCLDRSPSGWVSEFARDAMCACFAIHWHQRIAWDDILCDLFTLKPTVVVLYRRDLLAQYASLLIARATSIWDCYPGRQPPEDTFHIDLDEFDNWCKLQHVSVNDDMRWWGDWAPLLISYEELILDIEKVLIKISEMSGFGCVGGTSILRKRESRPISDVILNYPEAVLVAQRHSGGLCRFG